MMNLIFPHILKHTQNLQRNIIGYTEDNKPIIYNAKVPAKFKEDFDFKIQIEMSVCKNLKVGQ